MIHRLPKIRVIAFLMIVALPFAAFAADPVGRQYGGGSTMDWQLNSSGHEKAQLRWVGPDGEAGSLDFPNGRNVTLRLEDLGTEIVDGQYSWEVRLVPKVSKDVAKKLEAARAADDEKAAKKILKAAGIDPDAGVMSGAFVIANGMFVSTEGSEGGNAARTITTNATTRPSGPIAVDDQVIPDDLIVQGSICVGFDCVNNESFGFDTIRMKENNLRIKAEDTSVGSFPTNDWQLTFNDSASGGASKFSVEDVTGSKVPMTITAGASTNSIFVDSTGRVGFRTGTPVLDLHVTTSNTPAIRLEQTNAGGFTAQTWDIAGNEANFFVRDVTGGSRLPFRIRPGAPTSSIDISADGDVGIGTASPQTRVHIDNANLGESIRFGDTADSRMVGMSAFSDATGTLFAFGPNYSITSAAADQRYDAADEAWAFLASTRSGQDFFRVNRLNTSGTAATLFHVNNAGDVGINCNAPTFDLVIASGSGCTTPSSSINAGSAQFTVASSRTFKENIEPVAVPNILDKISQVPVFHYDYKQGPKDRLGLIAEDFHQVFGRGDDKFIDGHEVQLALWMAVQELTARNKALTDRLATLEQELKATK